MCGALRAEPAALGACCVLSSSLLKRKDSRLCPHTLSSRQWICVASGSSVSKWRPVLSGCITRHFLRFKCDSLELRDKYICIAKAPIIKSCTVFHVVRKAQWLQNKERALFTFSSGEGPSWPVLLCRPVAAWWAGSWDVLSAQQQLSAGSPHWPLAHPGPE